MEMCLLTKLRIDWSNDSGDFFPRELVKFILTNLKRNISPLRLQTNVNAHAQICFAAKSKVISPNGNPPLVVSIYKRQQYCDIAASFINFQLHKP